MHLDYVFPKCVAFGSEGGPEYQTVVHEADSGQRQVFIPWPVGRCRYNAQSGIKTLEDYETIYKLFRVCKGPGHTFDWYDYNDHQTSNIKTAPSHTDQSLGVGDAVEDTFQLFKLYSLAGEQEQRRIYRPNLSTFQVGVDGVATPTGWTWDAVNHVIVFDTPPGSGEVLTWGGEFYVPVGFTINYLPAAIRNKNADNFYCAYPIELLEVTL